MLDSLGGTENPPEVPLTPGDVVGSARFRSIHKDFYKGIYVPAGGGTAVSIRFRPMDAPKWGYQDRWLALGRRLDYTGQGGPPNSQSWNRFNLGLRLACEDASGVHVFEVLSGGSPQTYRYWGQWLVVSWYEHFNEDQERTILRFVLENPNAEQDQET